MIKATKVPHIYTDVRRSGATTEERTLRGRAHPAPSMDCRQGTHTACVWEHCECPQNCHAAQVHSDGKWRAA